jgi:hypothetical protein
MRQNRPWEAKVTRSGQSGVQRREKAAAAFLKWLKAPPTALPHTDKRNLQENGAHKAPFSIPPPQPPVLSPSQIANTPATRAFSHIVTPRTARCATRCDKRGVHLLALRGVFVPERSSNCLETGALFHPRRSVFRSTLPKCAVAPSLFPESEKCHDHRRRCPSPCPRWESCRFSSLLARNGSAHARP